MADAARGAADGNGAALGNVVSAEIAYASHLHRIETILTMNAETYRLAQSRPRKVKDTV